MTDFDFKQFKRMNYFTGFFTTADDWSAEQNYHMNKLRLHNQGVHTPGIMRGWMDELKVTAVGNRILVQSGAALDGGGNEIYVGEQVEVLPPKSFGDYTKTQTLYVTIEYNAIESDPVINPTQPEYNGNTRWKEEAKVSITETEPDNKTVLELARIFLRPPVSVVANPIDPASPGANEIDRRSILYAGSVCAPAISQGLEQPLKDSLIDSMTDTRKKFSDLDTRFPVPSCADTRNAAVTVEMMARSGILRSGQLTELFGCLAGIENDAGQAAKQFSKLTAPQNT